MAKSKLYDVGSVVGMLTLLERVGKNKHGQTIWRASCECGGEWEGCDVGLSSSIRGGYNVSCGCIRKSRSYEAKYGSIQEAFNQYWFRQVNNVHARGRGIEWHLSYDEFLKLICEPCHYCGAPPQLRTMRKDKGIAYPASGIDRIDSSLGYLPGNVVPCCSRCNVGKMDSDYEEFLQRSNRIAAMHPRAL